MSYFKLTQKQLASKAGLSENTISNAKKGGNVPNVNFFNSIFLAFPNIEPQWLYLGIGKMLIDEDYNELFSYKVESNYQMDCLKKINSLEKEIAYLQNQIKDKQEIIKLLKTNNSNI